MEDNEKCRIFTHGKRKKGTVMSVKSKEQIEEIFRRSRERKEKERLEQEKMKEQIKALEMKEYQKAYREKRKREKEAQRAKEQAQWERLRSIPMDDWILQDKGEFYTKYELEHIEELYPNERGRLSDRFFEIIEEAKKEYADWFYDDENFHTTTI